MTRPHRDRDDLDDLDDLGIGAEEQDGSKMRSRGEIRIIQPACPPLAQTQFLIPTPSRSSRRLNSVSPVMNSRMMASASPIEISDTPSNP